jgi:Fe-S protein assembly co-chaperone HscB
MSLLDDNYFEVFGIHPHPSIDTDKLRVEFLKLSRVYHPDYISSSDPEKASEFLDISSRINKAYNTLKDSDLRIRYYLLLQGVMVEGEQVSLPAKFMEEIMDIQEGIMEAKMEGDDKTAKILAAGLKAALDIEMEHLLEISEKSLKGDILQNLKILYYKRRYLLRILGNLNNIAD